MQEEPQLFCLFVNSICRCWNGMERLLLQCTVAMYSLNTVYFLYLCLFLFISFRIGDIFSGSRLMSAGL